MGSFNATYKLTTNINGVTAKMTSTESENTVEEFLDKIVILNTADGFTTIFQMSTTEQAGLFGVLRQLAIKNTGRTVVELMMRVPRWEATTAANDSVIDPNEFLGMSFLLSPGELIMLPNARVLSYEDELVSASNASYKEFVAVASGIHSTTGLLSTDGGGNWDTTNLAGSCSLTSATVMEGGVVPGSIKIRFYQPGYADFGYLINNLPAQTSSTDTGLTKGAQYSMKIAVDGAGAREIDFTVGSATNDELWGTTTGTTGVLRLMQAAADASPLLGDFSITLEGDIRFTSRSVGNQDGNSKVVFTSGTVGANLFGSGKVPVIGSIRADVPGEVSTTVQANWLVDDGKGALKTTTGLYSGTIDTYGTVAATEVGLSVNGPPNADMEVAWVYNSAHSADNSLSLPWVTSNPNNIMLDIKGRSVCGGEASGVSDPDEAV